jgi:hypothetical protein
MLTGSPVLGNQLPQRASDFSERDIRSEAERNHLFVKNISYTALSRFAEVGRLELKLPHRSQIGEWRRPRRLCRQLLGARVKSIATTNVTLVYSKFVSVFCFEISTTDK